MTQAEVVQILTEIAGAPVIRAESRYEPQYAPLLGNVRGFNDGTRIVLRPEVADSLVRLAQGAAQAQVNPSQQLWKNAARNMWVLMHEMGHFRKGLIGQTPEEGDAIEAASNTWAFNHFKPVARKMGMSKDQARLLYQALPAGYRAWHAGNRWSPDVVVPPKRLGG